MNKKNKKAAGGSQYIGKDGLTHYQRNKQKYIAKQVTRKRANVKYVRDIKRNLQCTDCGISDWRLIDFDHLPEHEKLDSISGTSATSWSREKIDEEIAKCEPVCANCHRIRTYTRAGIV